MFELLKSNQTGVLGTGSLAKGLLAGKPSSAYLDYRVEAVRKMQDALGQIAPSPKHLFKIALQFVLGNPAITNAVVGIRTKEQLKQILSFRPDTSDQDLNKLRNLLPLSLYSNHR